ncbi:uncharacterized protein Hap1MRO34_006400 [Clarias gariepinus]
MDDLADFLGHDIRVHRHYYRLPEGTFHLVKISKVRMALERGQLSEFKGRNLDETNIDPEEDLAVDSGASDTEVEDHESELDAASLTSLSSTQSSGSLQCSSLTLDSTPVWLAVKQDLQNSSST